MSRLSKDGNGKSGRRAEKGEEVPARIAVSSGDEIEITPETDTTGGVLLVVSAVGATGVDCVVSTGSRLIQARYCAGQRSPFWHASPDRSFPVHVGGEVQVVQVCPGGPGPQVLASYRLDQVADGRAHLRPLLSR